MPWILAALITIPAFILELALMRVDALALLVPAAPFRFAFYLTVVFPLIEEALRYGVLRWRGPWLATPWQAAGIGAAIGTFEAALKISADPAAALGWLTAVSSLPLHVALSLAFFSFAELRLLKTTSLHIGLNTFGLILGTALASAQIAPLPTVLTMLTAITAASAGLILVRRPAFQGG